MTHALFRLTLENAGEKRNSNFRPTDYSFHGQHKWSNLENISNSTLDLLDNLPGFRNGQLGQTNSQWWITQRKGTRSKWQGARLWIVAPLIKRQSLRQACNFVHMFSLKHLTVTFALLPSK